MIRWVFLDIGNVVFNDDPQTYFIHRRYHAAAALRNREFTFNHFLRDRELEVERGNRWPTQTVMRRHLTEIELADLYRTVTDETRGLYDELNFPMPHLQEMLDTLANRYRLGVIANQLTECRGSLERRGLIRYFDVVSISEERGLHKPDPALFQWAIETVGARPDEAVMVGDRHDNDVVPAAGLGMHTIWVRWPGLKDKGWSPEGNEVQAFIDSHEREPFYGRVTQPDIMPSIEVISLRDVAAAVDRLALSRSEPPAAAG